MAPKKVPAITRFMAKIQVSPDGCWRWLGAHYADGYAKFDARDGTTKRAGRWAYEHFVALVPDGLVVDHLCRNRGCVNPAHLEPVTQHENIMRGALPALTRARHASRTHCKHGHEFTSENTFLDRRGHRRCRVCMRAQVRGWYAKHGRG